MENKMEFFLASLFIHGTFLFFFLPTTPTVEKPITIEVKTLEQPKTPIKTASENKPLNFKKEEKIEKIGFKKPKNTNSFYGIGIAASCFVNRSLRIDETFLGYPADQVGLKSGDEILTINGYKISSTQDCLRIRSENPGSLSLTTFRPSTGETFNVSLPTTLIETSN